MTDPELVRTQTFPLPGPLELDIAVTVGKVEVKLDATEAEATVEIRHDPDAQQPWSQGISSLLSWVSERFGDQLGTDLNGTPADAVQQTRLEQTGNRLTVHAPKALPLRNIPLAITVIAPAGTTVETRAGSADVTVTGPAGRVDLATGAGEIRLDRTEGAATVRSGSGAIRLGPTLAGLQLRTGSGAVEVASLSGSATLATGTADVWLGTVSGSVLARSGSGDVTVAEAAGGNLELVTGSGDVRVGVRPGVTAEVDLTASAGTVSSELDVSLERPDGEVPLNVRARTGSGTVVVARAAQ
ncbi:DUF4097 family beta strand repeat-containing protein [Amycolatopsis granulosa]|uniref:DUF4097 family beta strand repeat-containing protein n=1 Tax=Amycolatopsis granulosa TaxID=185684 RepID=UPI001423CC67|nr:DUF4097 family beta strand repeat-containing protein [Amycolatopsis granulosa]NIH84294.1 hypothetical protein [Amycolatopsis granulosa]